MGTAELHTTRVSVIVPCFEQGALLGDALQSVLDQTHRNYEIIIVDDGSTDSTAEVAESFKSLYPNRINVITQKNQGQAVARQNGLEMATGHYIVMLDADDRLEPAMMEECLRAFVSNPQADIVVGNAWLVGTDGRERLRHFEQAKPVGWPQILQFNPYGALVATMIRRPAIDNVGGLAVEGPAGCEDWDLWVRCARCGMAVEPIARDLGCYRRHPDSYSFRPLTMLRAALGVLNQAARPDARLSLMRSRVAAPIDGATLKRLTNYQTLKYLGVGLAAGTDHGELEKISAYLNSALPVPTAMINAFLEGLEAGARHDLTALHVPPERRDALVDLLHERLRPMLPPWALHEFLYLLQRTLPNQPPLRQAALRTRHALAKLLRGR